jgi:hypothetical protein
LQSKSRTQNKDKGYHNYKNINDENSAVGLGVFKLYACGKRNIKNVKEYQCDKSLF